MIVSIEGPDRCGKSSLFSDLKRVLDAVYVQAPPFDPRLAPVVDLTIERATVLWDQLYDPSKLYIADRVPWISGETYAWVYERAVPTIASKWQDRTRVIYLRPHPTFEGYEPDPIAFSPQRAVSAYDMVLQKYVTHRFAVPHARAELALKAAEVVRGWRCSK